MVGKGLTVTVTKPDDSTVELGPYRTDSTGGTGAIYIPDMVGTLYVPNTLSRPRVRVGFPHQHLTQSSLVVSCMRPTTVKCLKLL